MRIISGINKGVTIYGPEDKKIRPLKDMVRESIFNFLIHSNKISLQIENSTILDLYSGTGSFGLECLSRLASKAIFIEKEKEAIEILKKNIKKLKMDNKTKILTEDVLKVINKNNIDTCNWIFDLKFDIIFCDPPFKDLNISKLIESIVEKKILKKDSIIILHRHKDNAEKLTKYLEVIDERVFGRSKITFGKPLSSFS